MSAAKQQQAIHQKVVRQTLARIAAHDGVLGYAVVNPKDGRIFEFAGFQNNRAMAEDFVEVLSGFLSVTQSMVRIIDRDDDLTFLRMRWRHREIIIAPDKEYALIVVQDKADDANPQKLLLAQMAAAQAAAASGAVGAGAGAAGGAAGGDSGAQPSPVPGGAGAGGAAASASAGAGGSGSTGPTSAA